MDPFMDQRIIDEFLKSKNNLLKKITSGDNIVYNKYFYKNKVTD
jgi:hypothetical protein